MSEAGTRTVVPTSPLMWALEEVMLCSSPSFPPSLLPYLPHLAIAYDIFEEHMSPLHITCHPTTDTPSSCSE
ncbi:unnamed protein product [Hydatigera taeniaeformis]|uniref:Uncharacterized protein n=1 Tax=Hydatigena taeniaeformis TaxID=6205 RepID=A0A0R3WYM1_HYDTA|nr:unnamed protein product [Hydatigera taeniaeformis]